MKAQPAFVAKPAFIDLHVASANRPINLAFARRIPWDAPTRCASRMINPQVASRAASGANGSRPVQEPRPDLEPEIRTGKCADRTHIDDVAGVRVIEGTFAVNRDFRCVSAIENHDFVRFGYIAREADAARTKNAAFPI